MKTTITKKAIALSGVLFFLLPLMLQCQSKPVTCAGIKTGIFYYYPKNATGHFIDVRDNEWLHERNMITGDSGLSKIKWIGDCTYTFKYISGNAKLPPQTRQFLADHDLVYEIVTITSDYYIFKGHIDKVSNPPFLVDTMWFNEKVNASNSELFQRMRNNSFLKKEHFNDTSKYAVVYVYRPGKLTNSLADFPLYFDDNFMCAAKNKTGYVFKILKEGQYEIKSRLYKDESAVKLDVKFGNVYYIKSMIHWGISSRLYNFKLETVIATPEQGKKEFEEVVLE